MGRELQPEARTVELGYCAVRSSSLRLLPVALGAALAASPGAAPGTARAAEGSVSPEVYERGERAMRRFCLSCHGSPGGHPPDPLGPRLRPELWGDPEQAYRNVGQLWRINRRMDQPFPGDDAERKALSEWLARRARENRTPAWKSALPWAGALAAAVVAGVLFLRSRRREDPRRPPA
jgi:mono/diheme cytochrome c family protein